MLNKKWMMCMISLGTLGLHAQNLTTGTLNDKMMTLNMVDSLVAQRNLSLQSAMMDVVAAEGELKQARSYENPEVEVMHNVRNPLNKKWFDTGYDSETDVQISQPIAIGGQHTARVGQAQSELNRQKALLELSKHETRSTARQTLIELYRIQQKKTIYTQELTSVERILSAYAEQAGKGNISKMQVFRLQSMKNELDMNLRELAVAEQETQSALRLLINQQSDGQWRASIPAAQQLARIQQTLAQAQGLTGGEADGSHPALMEVKSAEEAARYQLKAEKADALPHVSVKGEYDKNGSIGHDFFAIGASLTLPLWNQNKGNVKAAKANYQQAQMEHAIRRNELQERLKKDVATVSENLKAVTGMQQNMGTELEEMLQHVEEQMMKRHISVVEFVDYYESYRDAKLQQIDAMTELMLSHEELRRDLAPSSLKP